MLVQINTYGRYGKAWLNPQAILPARAVTSGCFSRRCCGGTLARATKAGVKVATGSHMWVRYPGKTRGQATKTVLRALVRAGMSPAAVIRAATWDAADVLGWSDRVGSLGLDPRP